MDSSSAVNGSLDQSHLEVLFSQQTTIKVKAKHTSSDLTADTVSVGMKQIYKSLTVLGDKIINKLNEILKNDLPDGIQSLKPEDHTPEATAQRIVDGVTGLMGIYAKQNPELKDKELLESFMKEIRKGIKQGYDEAMSILGDMGALDLEGVSSGIEKTMQLVEEKLQEFENNYLKNSTVEETTEENETQCEEKEK